MLEELCELLCGGEGVLQGGGDGWVDGRWQ